MRKCTDHPNRLEGWSTFQPGRLREIDVRFRHLPWNVDRLMDLLGIAGTLRVIDVGCGGGMFTRMIARHLDPASELVGIDIDPDMLAAARTESAREKLPLEIDWRPGEIDELPAPDRWADLTVCHTLLCNLVDVPRALVEMVRVTRPGGVVAAVEPSRRYLNYDPFISERLKQLSAKASRIVGAHLAWLRSRTQDPNPTPIPPEQLPRDTPSSSTVRASPTSSSTAIPAPSSSAIPASTATNSSAGSPTTPTSSTPPASITAPSSSAPTE